MAEPTPTVYFPDNFKFAWSPVRGAIFRTQILEMYNGAEQRRKQFEKSLEYWRGTSVPLAATDRDAILSFLEGRYGSFANFYFFRPDTATFTNYPCGNVSASSTFLLPFKDTSFNLSTGIKVDGVIKTVTKQAGTGAGGEDQVTFSGGSQTGAVSFTGTGRRRLVARFAVDDISESFYEAKDLLSVISIDIKELR